MSAPPIRTALTERLGLRWPIVQAPIGSGTTPELAAAVTNAGGLGTLSVTWLPAERTREAIREARERADGPIGVNVVLDPESKRLSTDEQLSVVEESGVGVASLALGAAGAWLGTRFVASEEAALDDRYKERVVRADETETVYSELFDGGWPGQPHRTLRNRAVERWEAAGRPPPGERPGEGERVAELPNGRSVERYSDVLPLAGMSEAVDDLALYAGQSAGLTDSVRPAAEIVEALAAEAVDAVEDVVALVDA